LDFWGENVPGLAARGVAKNADSAALGMLCYWYALWRKRARALDRLPAVTKKLHQTIVQVAIAFDKFEKLAARFGLTPSDRAKLGVGMSGGGRRGGGVATRRRGAS